MDERQEKHDCGSNDVDNDVRMALAQALREQKLRVTDRRILILYCINIIVLLIVATALWKTR